MADPKNPTQDAPFLTSGHVTESDEGTVVLRVSLPADAITALSCGLELHMRVDNLELILFAETRDALSKLAPFAGEKH